MVIGRTPVVSWLAESQLSPHLPRYPASPLPPIADLDTPKGGNVTQPRAADDFPAIRARMEELRREREGVQQGQRNACSKEMPVRGRRMGEVSMALRRLRDRGRLSLQVGCPLDQYPAAVSRKMG